MPLTKTPRIARLLIQIVVASDICHQGYQDRACRVSEEKIQAAFEFESGDLISDAERAALRVAPHAGMHPNAVESEHMKALQQFYSDKQCVEIVAVISLFGYLNRWNDTMATTLEDGPRAFASDKLA
ncbi:MAG: hypothetical protein KDC54_12140 [Lewinella sp.]|nr:hypothetical protein [Lewinella sp.]